jgi:ankyrin repeat protein
MNNHHEKFLEAVTSGDLAAVRRALENNPELLELRPRTAPSTPLLALYHGNEDMARFLVRHGAPASIFEAAALGLVERSTVLLDQDPELVNACNSDGFQPLGLACFFNEPEVARLLLARGAEVNSASRNPQMVMPLHSAVTASSRDLVSMLLSHGADVNARQQGDFTPLHEAALAGDMQIAEMLLAAGAVTDALTGKGLSPADMARDDEMRTLLRVKPSGITAATSPI